jgi:hypothetical protein
LDSFGRIGTFQWVTANPNKKISSHLNPRARLRSERANSIRLPPPDYAIAKARTDCLAKYL